MDEPIKVQLLGRAHTVATPQSLIEQEEIYIAWREASEKPRGLRIIRAAAAVVGMCTRIGRESGVTYAEAGCDPLVYGGKVYDWLRTQGPKAVDGLVVAAKAIEPSLQRSLIAVVEAQEKAVFSEPRAGA